MTEERDMTKQPYTADERRVVDYLMELFNNQVGAGPDPIGFLIASHRAIRSQLTRFGTLDGQRIFGPLPADHWSVKGKELCPLCGVAFVEGDMSTLVATAPASDEDAQKAIEGRPYTAEAEHVHAACWLVARRA